MARRSECPPKSIYRFKHDSLIDLTNRSACAFRFGDRRRRFPVPHHTPRSTSDGNATPLSFDAYCALIPLPRNFAVDDGADSLVRTSLSSWQSSDADMITQRVITCFLA